MKKTIISGLAALMAFAFTSCDDVFTPSVENNLPLEYIEKNAHYADGLLGVAYIYLPNGSWAFNEPATDDAVSNDPGNSWRNIAAGRWTASNNPMNRWDACRGAIQYINLFLENVENITWSDDEVPNKLFRDRYYGEAHGLRAIFMYYLLQSHAGFSASGDLLGVPIVTKSEGIGSNFNVPRNTFRECVEAMKEDAKIALENIPMKYGADAIVQMKSKYPEVGEGTLERVYGEHFTGRIDGRVIEAYLARIDLLAASPAFQASGTTWAEAANSNAKVLKHINGPAGIDMGGLDWYADPNIEQYEAAYCPPEVMWRTSQSNNHDLEGDNYPPTLYGNGRINPTQNLVDAFPMLNGYPISDPRGNYNAADPYAGRDPRLKLYILCNGEKAGSDNTQIITTADGTDNNALDKISTSTRTGYYLKKHLNQNVNCNPSNIVNKAHYTARLRYTEFFLNYAEAANEAWGPTNGGSNGFSAYDVIKAIRSRAGIGLDNGDQYLESIKGDKDAMRELIRNERRLELCFEGFRFYDLRRWKANLNETAKRMYISGNTYKVEDLETRNYKDYMYYGPIPYNEVLKFSELIQNAGW